MQHAPHLENNARCGAYSKEEVAADDDLIHRHNSGFSSAAIVTID